MSPPEFATCKREIVLEYLPGPATKTLKTVVQDCPGASDTAERMKRVALGVGVSVSSQPLLTGGVLVSVMLAGGLSEYSRPVNTADAGAGVQLAVGALKVTVSVVAPPAARWRRYLMKKLLSAQ